MKTELKQTSNYDLFVLNETNRPMHDLRALLASMVKHGFIQGCAIYVTPTNGGKLKIIAGHHRFAAAKQLGIPLWYIVTDTEVSPIELELFPRIQWTGADIIKSEAQAGNQNYIVLSEFMEKHRMNIAPAAGLVGGDSARNTGKMKLVKSGKFKIGDMTHANEVASITDLLLAKGCEFATETAFVGALSQVMKLPDVSIDTLKERVDKYAHILKKRGTRIEYLEEIEALYNYNARQKLPLKFMAQTLGAKRQGDFGGNRHIGAFKKKSA